MRHILQIIQNFATAHTYMFMMYALPGGDEAGMVR